MTYCRHAHIRAGKDVLTARIPRRALDYEQPVSQGYLPPDKGPDLCSPLTGGRCLQAAPREGPSLPLRLQMSQLL